MMIRITRSVGAGFIFSLRFIFVVFICCFSLTGYAAPEDKDKDKDSKLKGIIKQIDSVKIDIDRKAKQQITVLQQLKNLKIKISKLESAYSITLKNLKKQKAILSKLNADQAKQQIGLQDARQKFFVQIQEAYKVECPDYLQSIAGVLENQQINSNPEILLAYHKYVFVARLAQLHDIRKTLDQIEVNKQQIKKQAKVLEDLEGKQKQQKQDLLQAQEERNNLLGSLKSKIESQSQKLKQLINDKKNLEKLIERLEKKLELGSTGSKSKVISTPICRNFVWPTKGMVTTHFGSSIGQSSWSWSGIIISAPADQEVHAISPGKVVYADWFAGYGLLLIIDHGSGYMSLYGHNKVFHKKVNDRVEAGEVISSVGQSDCDSPSLYFAIRYNSRPVNPEKWCRK